MIYKILLTSLRIDQKIFKGGQQWCEVTAIFAESSCDLYREEGELKMSTQNNWEKKVPPIWFQSQLSQIDSANESRVSKLLLSFDQIIIVPGNPELIIQV